MNKKKLESEAQIKRPDFLWLAGAVIAGGVAAPITLLFSLKITPAATASLLLNFEGVATTFIAVLVFKEAISRRAWWAVGLITLSSIILSINLSDGWGFSIGALGIIAACILWGIDNNFTRNISAKDPLSIVTIKGLAAGSFSLALALVLGNPLPVAGVILRAMLLGCFCYGISIVLFIRAMRSLGAARTSAVFGTAPLAGMILSFLVFRELPGGMFFVALPLMVIGTLFLAGEEHIHQHLHSKSIHEHSHSHKDGHHEQDHDGEPIKSHSHLHTHADTEHSHHHMPDIHHRHVHFS
ncbi:MAG: DMT(drug/metabolite transporter) superfamily permease [Chloroflexi bacterium]|nr:MAG: DMT(drug/metabolite transporter) superfamily permease [Chloroflexota bacterium]